MSTPRTRTRTAMDGISVDANYDVAHRHGNFFWYIQLVDGREMAVFADRYEVSHDGTLTLWSETKVVPNPDPDALLGWTRTPDEPHRTMSLPAGQWLVIYAASIIDGCPVAVDHLEPRRRDA